MIGKLISLEGPDGSGKSTNGKHLAAALRKAGYDVVETREPGGTDVGEEIREVLLRKRGLLEEQIDPMTELLLFIASRAQHINKKLKPMLAAGKIVITDRFCDTSYAYQGYGRGLIGKYLELEKMVHDQFFPDYTLFFNVTLPTSERRLIARTNESNRLDDETLAFKRACFDGYQIRLKNEAHRMHVIDAELEPIEVQKQVEYWVNWHFIPANPIGPLVLTDQCQTCIYEIPDVPIETSLVSDFLSPICQHCGAVEGHPCRKEAIAKYSAIQKGE